MKKLWPRNCLTLGSIFLWTPLPSWGFSFSYSAPKSCDPFEVDWNGGNGPFTLLLTPPSGTPWSVSIPDAAWNGSSGSFTTTLNYTVGQSFILTMSDADGFGTGGNSDLLLVGGGTTNPQCNTTSPSAPFSFQTPSSVQQCATYLFSGYDAATQPVQIQGLIPLGSSFAINPPNGSTSYDWTVNVASGTRVLFFMKDAKGRFGTASSLQQISDSNNGSCIDGNSPHSTISSATEQPTSTASEPSQGPGSGGQQHGNNAAIIGGAVGAGVAFLLAIILLVFCLKRRRVDPMKRYSRKRAKNGLGGMRALDLAPSTPNLHAEPNRLPPMEFEPQPFLLPPASSNSGGDNVPMSPTTHSGRSQADASFRQGHISQNPSHGTTDGTHSSAAARKAAMAGPSSQGLAPPPRFVLHTDAGSVDNMNASTVELPPTYNAASQTGGSSGSPSSGNTFSPSGVGTGGTQNPLETGNRSSDLHSQDHHRPDAGSSTANLTASNH